jgi:hypothetical protein
MIDDGDKDPHAAQQTTVEDHQRPFTQGIRLSIPSTIDVDLIGISRPRVLR